MRYRAGLTWMVIWAWVAQLLLTGPVPSVALSSSSPAGSTSALGLADLGVAPVYSTQPRVLESNGFFPVGETFASLLEPSSFSMPEMLAPSYAGPPQGAESREGLDGLAEFTDERGSYRFRGLPSGTHKVTLDVQTLPADLRPPADEEPIVLWVTPGMEQVSEAFSTGVRFTVHYDRESGDLFGYVFWDQDGDGQMDEGEPGLPGVRVVDPTLHQYFVPFDDVHLWQLFEGKAQCHNPNHVACLPMVSDIFVTSGSDGTVVYYDHWEDGYDKDPVNPANGGTTLILVLDAGASQIFSSDIDPSNVGPTDTPVYYDGRDRITIRGEDAYVIRLVNASGYDEGNGRGCQPETKSGWLASAWEVKEVAEWGVQYHTVVGEDLIFGAGANDHDFSGLEVMAWQDNTTLYYQDREPVVLNAGETFFVPGVGPSGGRSGVQSHDHLTATQPVQVQMLTGGCSDRIVSAHGYTLFPEHAWGRAYWAPVPGFVQSEYCANDPPEPNGETQWDVLNSDIDTDIYLHNPSLDNEIEVTIVSGDQAETITVGVHTTVSVLAATGWSDLATGTAGTYLYSDQEFWGLVVVDSATRGLSGSDDFDWGYSLLSEEGLSSQVIIGYGPGYISGTVANPPAYTTKNGNLAFVLAVVTTTVYVDLNQDGLPDPFDMDGDGDHTTLNVWGVPGWDEPTSALGVPVGAGQVLRVGDPFDGVLRGARIYTEDLKDHIAVAWGQDPCSAWYLKYLDLGYTVLPSPIPRLSKDARLAIDADLTRDISPGDILTYTLVLYNNGQRDMNQVWLTDTLPYEESVFERDSLSVSYLAPTSRILYRDGPVWGTSPITGAQAFSVYWPTLTPGQVVTITFRSKILDDTLASELVNEAVVVSANTDPVIATVETPIVRPHLGLEKWVDRTTVSHGEPFTYTILVSNTDTSTGAAVDTRLWDVLPPWINYVTGTLSVQWPQEVFFTETVEVSRTSMFHGTYADNLDQTPDSSSGYSGSDGSLDWASDWTEVGEVDGPDTGSVQVLVDPPNALSAPAYIWMGDLDSPQDEVGLTRQLDLSQFVSPTVRLHRSGTAGISGEYSVYLSGGLVAGSTEQYAGDYGFVEFELPPMAYAMEALGLLVNGMAANDVYRFDHLSVFEKQPERSEIVFLSRQYSQLEPRSVANINPVSYDPLSKEMVITDSLRLPAQGVMTVTMMAVLDPQVTITETLYLTNTAYVRARNRPETLQDTAVVTISANTADLAIVKGAEPGRVIKANDRTVTYTLVYTNYGPVAAENVTLTDTLPNEVTFDRVVSQPAGWTGPTVGTDTPVTLTWVTPTLEVGQSGEIVLTVIVADDFAGVMTNYTHISTETPESRYDNNQDQVETEVDTLADVTIAKSGEPNVVSVGDQLVYTLAYTNNGPDPALNVVVSDTLIPEVQFVSARPSPCPPTDVVLWWELGTLAAGQSGTIVVTTTVTSAAVDTFTNTVVISTTTPETNYDNNQDDDPTDVTANVAIVKSGTPDVVVIGDQLVYTLVYINEGPAMAENVVVSDTLIPEINFVAASLAPRMPINGVLYWDLGSLAAGAGGTIVVTATVTAEAQGTFTNTAEIATTTPESRYDDNVDDDPTDIALADIAIEKVVSHREAAPGESLVYTLTYRNLGSVPAHDVVVWDDLPDEIVFDRAVPAPTVAKNPLSWSLGTLEVGASGIILVYAHVRDDIEQGIDVVNVARIQTSTEESDYDNNHDSAPTPVRLLGFTAHYVPGAVILEWQTVWEVRTYGFKLYRGRSDLWRDAEQIAFIFAAGHGQSGGARYGYKDAGVGHGGVYYYWLVDVDLDGSETVHGPIEVTALPKLTHFARLLLFVMPQWVGVYRAPNE